VDAIMKPVEITIKPKLSKGNAGSLTGRIGGSALIYTAL
jgi:hypothetical protein